MGGGSDPSVVLDWLHDCCPIAGDSSTPLTGGLISQLEAREEYVKSFILVFIVHAKSGKLGSCWLCPVKASVDEALKGFGYCG